MVCVDYRSLNRITVNDPYPLQRIEGCIDSLGGAKYFSSLDLIQRYLQVTVAKDGISCPGIALRVQQLPLELSSCPFTCLRLMGKCLGDVTGKGFIIYLEIVTVYSGTVSEMTDKGS